MEGTSTLNSSLLRLAGWCWCWCCAVTAVLSLALSLRCRCTRATLMRWPTHHCSSAHSSARIDASGLMYVCYSSGSSQWSSMPLTVPFLPHGRGQLGHARMAREVGTHEWIRFETIRREARRGFCWPAGCPVNTLASCWHVECLWKPSSVSSMYVHYVLTPWYAARVI